jgi:hypothetical protein
MEFPQDRNRMNRRIVALFLTIMITFSVLTIGIGFALAGTRYGFQEHVSGEVSQAMLRISELTNCNLTITFSDEPNLFYRIDIEYNEPVPIWFAYPRHEITVGQNDTGAHIYPSRGVKSLNITVGPVVDWLYITRCWNLISTIVYDDDVGLNQSLMYYASGSLNVTVTEDIRSGIGASITSDDVRLDITVPIGLSGGVFFHSISFTVERTGWPYSVDIYSDTHAYGTHDGFYNNSTAVIADLAFLVDCDDLFLKLVS